MSFPTNDNLMAQLIQSGYSGDINTALVRYLRAQYALTGGQYNDLLFYHLGQLGYTGSLNDRIRQWDGTLFSPIALFSAGEVGVWYDPSDFSTMFQDDAGTTPVTAVGDPVGKINDKSGNGYHATQSTSTARPVLQQDSNGRYYLAFDGTDDFLVTSAIDFTGTDKMSVFAGVYKGQDAATAIIVELSANSTGNAGTFYMTAPSTSGATDARFAVIDGVAATVTADKTSGYTTGLSVLAGTSDNSADTVQLRFNATLAQLTSTVQAATVFDSAPIYIGMRGGATLPFNGRIYSLIVRGALSDATQIAAAEAYVNSKTAAY